MAVEITQYEKDREKIIDILNGMPYGHGYNYQDLKDEDREFIDGMIEAAIHHDTACDNAIDDMMLELSGALNNIVAEVCHTFADKVQRLQILNIKEHIISIMDNDEYYQEDGEE